MELPVVNTDVIPNPTTPLSLRKTTISMTNIDEMRSDLLMAAARVFDKYGHSELAYTTRKQAAITMEFFLKGDPKQKEDGSYDTY
jgi:hypothetical protein